MYRKTFLEIDLNSIYHNLDVFSQITNKKMMAVVKANAYGLIDYYIAKKLESKGVDFFAVSSLDEAVRLRKHGVKSNILIMGYVNDLYMVKTLDLAIIIPSKDFVDTYKDELEGVRVHIKVNTGLNRLGVFPNEAKEVLDILLNAKAKAEGVMTHYACGENKEYSLKQYDLFKNTVLNLNYDFKYIHAEATDVALYVNDDISNYCRVGLGLYGYANIDLDDKLLPAIKLFAEVICCKKVAKGEGVSYSHKYISDGEGYINTVAIGYADGVNKKLENCNVMIGSEIGKVVGTICMDLMLVKSEHQHKVGELVEIYGNNFDLKTRRKDFETNICSIITGIQNRVIRVYKENGVVIDEINMNE